MLKGDQPGECGDGQPGDELLAGGFSPSVLGHGGGARGRGWMVRRGGMGGR